MKNGYRPVKREEIIIRFHKILNNLKTKSYDMRKIALTNDWNGSEDNEINNNLFWYENKTKYINNNVVKTKDLTAENRLKLKMKPGPKRKIIGTKINHINVLKSNQKEKKNAEKMFIMKNIRKDVINIIKKQHFINCEFSFDFWNKKNNDKNNNIIPSNNVFERIIYFFFLSFILPFILHFILPFILPFILSFILSFILIFLYLYLIFF